MLFAVSEYKGLCPDSVDGDCKSLPQFHRMAYPMERNLRLSSHESHENHSKPLGLARFAWVKTSDAARRRPYVSSSLAYVENPVFQTHFHDYPSFWRCGVWRTRCLKGRIAAGSWTRGIQTSHTHPPSAKTGIGNGFWAMSDKRWVVRSFDRRTEETYFWVVSNE